MKGLKFFILLLISLLWLGGCSDAVRHALYETNVIADEYRYGDLYRLSNLPQFKESASDCPPVSPPADSARTHLYVLGDSFTEPSRLRQQDVPVSYFRRMQWDKPDTVQLDPAARNVLLIESVERHFREHADPSAATPIERQLVVVGDTNGTIGQKSVEASWGRQLTDLIHAKGIEERLETVLFSQNFFLWFREVKATLTQKAFNRISPNVSLSRDGKYLFTALDTDTTKIRNAVTAPLADAEVDTLVQEVNRATAYYRSKGFSQVILSIIPNKATLLDPTRQPYNHLIERVQQHSSLRVPTVDVYTLFRQQHQPVYARGDSHWNCTGRAIWLRAVAQQLRQPPPRVLLTKTGLIRQE